MPRRALTDSESLWDSKTGVGPSFSLLSAQSTIATFTARLETDWKLKITCQRQCKQQECKCPQFLFHVDEMMAWMNTEEKDDEGTPIDRMLDELRPKMSEDCTFRIESQHIVSGENSCQRVFGILLYTGHGELIDLFYRANLVDRCPSLAVPPRAHSVHMLLVSRMLSQQIDMEFATGIADKIISEYQQAKAAFYYPSLTLHMDVILQGARLSMPFCRYTPVNDKGGTTTVFQASLQKFMVRDPGMVKAVEKSLYTDPDFGECYTFAIKSYRESSRDLYDLEKSAFVRFRQDETSPIIRSFGFYNFIDGDNSTYNIILEYGERDIYEFFADPYVSPPIRLQEIQTFWGSLFEVSKAIRAIHEQSSVSRTERIFPGWHADIKPDNILRVNGEFKLADFGFAEFIGRDDVEIKEPRLNVLGGTHSYGAPEVHQAKLSESPGRVTQAIDIWSFGCVLSVSATWIVLGFQGIVQFGVLRSRANQKLEGRGAYVTDRFHDGLRVLPEIKHWHNFLRRHRRVDDTLTPLVLDLVEAHMLTSVAMGRLPISDLIPKLNDVLVSSDTGESSMNGSPVAPTTHISVLEAVAEVENAAEKSAFRAYGSLRSLNRRRIPDWKLHESQLLRITPHMAENLTQDLRGELPSLDGKGNFWGVIGGADGAHFQRSELKMYPSTLSQDDSQSSNGKEDSGNSGNRFRDLVHITDRLSNAQGSTDVQQGLNESLGAASVISGRPKKRMWGPFRRFRRSDESLLASADRTSKHSSYMVVQTFAAYDDFPWETLEQYLKRKWPD